MKVTIIRALQDCGEDEKSSKDHNEHWCVLTIAPHRIDHMPFMSSSKLLKEAQDRTGPRAGPPPVTISEPVINSLGSITEQASNISSTEAGF